ncbi:MAG: UvrD-helicase domain-containing protein [Treponema sp.]|nr:UvrD-helicase domain-containing protein [Treponema sp.]
MEASLPPYLASLNPEQLEAVRHSGGPLLILAGAGSGKTRVITTKIAYLVRERGVEPESILAVTFTNKAAREMRDRAAAIEPRCGRSTIRTFHSFGAWFLRRNAAAAGLDPNFVIYDDDDSTTLLHAAFPQYTRSECGRIASALARAKDLGLEPDSPDLSAAFRDPQLRRAYAVYEERLRRTGNVDFGDLIRLPARLLRDDPAVARRTRQRFRVILVDEYQDSNVAQFELLRLLAEPSESSAEGAYLCVVGDDDQSIYRFRGAEIRNILEFPSIFPGTSVVKLERNYRSRQSILDVAGQVVSRNAGRLGKELRAERGGGERPKLVLLEDQDEEAAHCARLCEARVGSGGSWSDLAILYRTNAQSLTFEQEFSRRRIPYRLVGALRFYEREEIKDSLAYLALISNRRDEVAWKRVVNKPSRGIGEASAEAVLALAEGESPGGLGDLVAASRRAAETVKGKARSGLTGFAELVDGLGGLLAAGPSGRSGDETLAAFLEAVVKRTGLADYHRGQDEIAGTQKIANLDELVNAASIYPRSAEGLAAFLETIELDRSLIDDKGRREGQAPDAVTLITMHNTKGLEFPVVIVTGMEQGLFPRDDEEGEDLEEQRRLFYVAITRAKDELYLSACRWRRLHGRLSQTLPSRFLSEIEADSLERAGPGSGDREARRNGERRYGQSLGEPGGAGPRGTAGQARGAGAERPEASPWRAGQAVYHDDYGSGVIIKVSPTPSSGPLVVVRFETGRQAQFFPRFTSKLEPSRT